MRIKSFAGLLFSASLFTLAACGGLEAEPPSDAPPSPEMIESAVQAQQALFVAGTPLCDDIEVHIARMQFCPLGGGGPASVECSRDCVTERHMQWTGPQPGGSPQFICVTGETECSNWVCDPC